MTEKLKPCPFCGVPYPYITFERGYLDDSAVVFCNACKISVKLEENDQEGYNDVTKRKAIEAWNRRAEVQDDLISRHSAIEFIENVPYIKEHPNLGTLFREWMTQVIAAQPMQKTGRWIFMKDCEDWFCSNCKDIFMLLEGTPKDNDYNYCPNCGAKMESEGKDDKI